MPWENLCIAVEPNGCHLARSVHWEIWIIQDLQLIGLLMGTIMWPTSRLCYISNISWEIMDKMIECTSLDVLILFRNQCHHNKLRWFLLHHGACRMCCDLGTETGRNSIDNSRLLVVSEQLLAVILLLNSFTGPFCHVLILECEPSVQVQTHWLWCLWRQSKALSSCSSSSTRKVIQLSRYMETVLSTSVRKHSRTSDLAKLPSLLPLLWVTFHSQFHENCCILFLAWLL